MNFLNASAKLFTASLLLNGSMLYFPFSIVANKFVGITCSLDFTTCAWSCNLCLGDNVKMSWWRVLIGVTSIWGSERLGIE